MRRLLDEATVNAASHKGYQRNTQTYFPSNVYMLTTDTKATRPRVLHRKSCPHSSAVMINYSHCKTPNHVLRTEKQRPHLSKAVAQNRYTAHLDTLTFC